MPQQVHAHICEKCFADGVETIWIHGDIHFGDVQKHQCPKCGSVQWKKFLVPVGQLPKHRNAHTQVPFVAMEPMEYAMLISVVFIAMFTCAWLAMELWRARLAK